MLVKSLKAFEYELNIIPSKDGMNFMRKVNYKICKWQFATTNVGEKLKLILK